VFSFSLFLQLICTKFMRQIKCEYIFDVIHVYRCLLKVLNVSYRILTSFLVDHARVRRSLLSALDLRARSCHLLPLQGDLAPIKIQTSLQFGLAVWPPAHPPSPTGYITSQKMRGILFMKMYRSPSSRANRRSQVPIII
jgi:hypothetical protein